MKFNLFSKYNYLSKEHKKEVVQFLHIYLELYGDPIEDIEKAVDYALSESENRGGFVLVSYLDSEISGAVVVNQTGMEGYVPENILVYIATRKELRGCGIGKALLSVVIENTEGNIALHVEPDNPALFLYRGAGFENKYLEMRLIK